ncbi:MAG TPA: hypothetical protein VF756_10200 [Thermoanaerobaculia bacterium]
MIWLLLTAAYLGGWAISRWVLHAGWEITPEDLVHAAAVPLAQVAALRGVSAFRRMFR